MRVEESSFLEAEGFSPNKRCFSRGAPPARFSKGGMKLAKPCRDGRGGGTAFVSRAVGSAERTVERRVDPDLAAVLANPADFYVNVHTTEFQNGAVRGQIPEPATALLLGAGLLGLAASSGRRVR
jgi:CHRD domain-containing protein/PEP-CTERM motif-containing protein